MAISLWPLRRLVSLTGAALLLGTASVYAANVTIAWDPSQGASGYKLLWGTALGSYPNSIDAGTATTATITGLAPGASYWAVATAYAANGEQSVPSTPLQFTVPCSNSVTPTTLTPAAAGQSGSLTVTAGAQCAWNAATSSNFMTLQNGTNRAGSGSVGYTIAANFSTNGRNTTADVAGQTVTITQAGAAPDATLQAAEHARADFNGDGFSDLVWQDMTGGALATWMLAGSHASRTPVSFPYMLGDLNWHIVGTADFNGDGKPDLLFHHELTGDLFVWYMNGLNRIGTSWFSTTGMPDVGWHVVAVADFNGDGKPDILWQHDSGAFKVWYVDGTTVTGTADLTPSKVLDPGWRVIGAADMNGDGQTDLVFRYMPTGDLVVWYMNGTTRTDYASLGRILDPAWELGSIIDINGDQTPDLVWYHTTQGMVAVWYMNGIVRTDVQMFPFTIKPNWRIAGPK